LIAGCITNNFEVVKLLVDSGAEVNKPSNSKITPLTASFIKLYNDTNIYENRMICFKTAQMLLESNADINWIIDKKNGWTFIMQLAATSQKLSDREISLIA